MYDTPRDEEKQPLLAPIATSSPLSTASPLASIAKPTDADTMNVSARHYARRRVRVILSLLVLGLCTLVYFHATESSEPLSMMRRASWTLLEPDATTIEDAWLDQRPIEGGAERANVQELVPLEAHVMSKCPDTRDCLRQMILPTMQRVVDKVNFTLSYIGTVTANDGVACKHGPAECLGNIIELCAAKLYPDPKTYLGFTMCLTKDYQDIPQRSLVEDCALEHGLDFEKVNECTAQDDGGLGMDMLQNSVLRTTNAGVTKSCTVRLNNEIYCIRDGGEWKDCPSGANVNDLVATIEKLYAS